MAPVTYYYFFSIITAITPLLWLINLIYMRLRNQTIIGRSYKIGTPVYERAMKVASGRNILITTVITLLALANLAWSIVTVLGVNTLSAQWLLVIAPIIALGAFIVMIIKVRREQGAQFKEEARKRTSSKQKGKDDSWLS